MAKILLFGSHNIKGVPQSVIDWLDKCNKAGNSFMVGDRMGSDEAFHRALSLVGAENVEIVGLNRISNNKFNFNERKLVTEWYDDNKVRIKDIDGTVLETISGIESEDKIFENKDIVGFKDFWMIRECDLALCLYDGKSKKIDNLLQIFGLTNKECTLVRM